MRACVIDIGSRSIKMIIAETGKTDIRILESLKNVIPIAHDVFLNGRISQETINQTIGVLMRYRQVIKDYDVPEIKIIATTAVREARNREIFLDAVLRKTDFGIEVLSVGDIVYYIDAFLSHKFKDGYPIHTKNVLIAELGSGSLDVSLMKQGLTLTHVGLPIGTLRIRQFMNNLDAPLADTIDATSEYITNEFNYLRRVLPKAPLDDIILIDETYATHLSHIFPDIQKNTEFIAVTQSSVLSALEQIRDKNAEDISRDFKIPFDIAETMPAYMITLKTLSELSSNSQIFVLETSLAEAILTNILFELEISKKYNKINQLISVAQEICRKYNVDLPHAQQVADLSEILFMGLRDQLGLKKDQLLYLQLAAYLHDIGSFIHNRGHHKHSEYIISSLNLSRLTDDEIKTIACTARYHRKAAPMATHPIYNSLPMPRKILVQKLSAILRVSNALDSSHQGKIKKIDIRINPKQDIIISVSSSGNALLEQTSFQDSKKYLEEITGSKISLVVKS